MAANSFLLYLLQISQTMSETLCKLLKARKKADIEIKIGKTEVSELRKLGAGCRILHIDVHHITDACLVYEQPDGKRYYHNIVYV